MLDGLFRKARDCYGFLDCVRGRGVACVGIGGVGCLDHHVVVLQSNYRFDLGAFECVAALEAHLQLLGCMELAIATIAVQHNIEDLLPGIPNEQQLANAINKEELIPEPIGLYIIDIRRDLPLEEQSKCLSIVEHVDIHVLPAQLLNLELEEIVNLILLGDLPKQLLALKLEHSAVIPGVLAFELAEQVGVGAAQKQVQSPIDLGAIAQFNTAGADAQLGNVIKGDAGSVGQEIVARPKGKWGRRRPQ